MFEYKLFCERLQDLQNYFYSLNNFNTTHSNSSYHGLSMTISAQTVRSTNSNTTPTTLINKLYFNHSNINNNKQQSQKQQQTYQNLKLSPNTDNIESSEK